MKFLALLLVLFSALNARSRYVLGKKNDFWNGYSADTVCLNKGGDSLTLVLKQEMMAKTNPPGRQEHRPTPNPVFKEERVTIPLDTVDFLTLRERKSLWPYLLTAAIVGGSTYTTLRLTGRDDAMYTAEGKARFAGILLGGIVLNFSTMIKEAVETRTIINLRRGINRTEALIMCSF